jgi:8-oxo-dGTP pyrophosphatase MutT (NUDIX family)
MEPLDGKPMPSHSVREAAVTALLIAPHAVGSCGPALGNLQNSIHPFDCQVLLIERAQGGFYGGQLALPGGKMEPGELPIETALREFKEELGVDLQHPAVSALHVGSLDAVYSPETQFLIHVMVVLARTLPQCEPEPTEVAAMLGIPLGAFDPRLPLQVHVEQHRGELLQFGAVPAPGKRRVWGLTARFLSELAGRVAEVSGQ